MSISTSIDGFTIRPAERHETPKILYFIRELARFEGELEFVDADEETLSDSIFVKKAAEVVFGEFDAEIVAFAVFTNSFSTFLGKAGINLVDLYVEPEMRNRGLGNEMLKYLAKTTNERKCGRLEWWVHDWNTEAKRFYGRIGSKEVDKIRVYRLAGKELEEYGGSF